MKIGITEHGDASCDFTWCDKLTSVDGAVIITKNISDTFIAKFMTQYNNGHKLILHATCTGWGNSSVEPNVPDYMHQLNQLQKLIASGFPMENCVLRIDPIFPTTSGLTRVAEVLSAAINMKILPDMRVRISVLDEYKHVKQRFIDAGFAPIYGDSFYAPFDMMHNLTNTLRPFANKGIKFYTCAEKYLTDDIYIHDGCISQTDLQILNLSDYNGSINPQNRTGCCCLGCKTELLNTANKHRCPHQCLYCFWKD